MMDPLTGLNRGYCFVTFDDRQGAQEAVKQVTYVICRIVSYCIKNFTFFENACFVGKLQIS